MPILTPDPPFTHAQIHAALDALSNDELLDIAQGAVHRLAARALVLRQELAELRRRAAAMGYASPLDALDALRDIRARVGAQ